MLSCPFTPLLFSKTGVYRDKHFLIFALKHKLLVLVRTASHLKIDIFTSVNIAVYCIGVLS